MTGERPPPPPPPPESFPTPFASERPTGRTQHVATTSTYPPAGPPPGDNRHIPMPSPGAHTSQLYHSTQPPPPPVRRSTRPPSNVTAPPPAPTRAFTTQPAPPYEYVAPPLAPQMSGSSSHHSSISESGQSMPPPFTATYTNASGRPPPPPPPTMPVPYFPNTAASVPPHHYGSSPPNMGYPQPQPVRSEGPPSNAQDWSYLEVHERDDLSSESEDEELVESPDSMSNSSGHRLRGPTSPPTAGRRRRTRRRESAPAGSSQQPLDLERCRLCSRLGPRYEWARLGHGGFCCERHKWQWEDTNMVHRSRGPVP